jgi:hypothetical protein
MSYKKIVLERYYLEQSHKKINKNNNKISKLQKTLKLKKEKKEKIKENLKKARTIYKENREKKTETEIENEKINNEEKFITIDNYIFRDYYNNTFINNNK